MQSFRSLNSRNKYWDQHVSDAEIERIRVEAQMMYGIRKQLHEETLTSDFTRFALTGNLATQAWFRCAESAVYTGQVRWTEAFCHRIIIEQQEWHV